MVFSGEKKSNECRALWNNTNGCKKVRTSRENVWGWALPVSHPVPGDQFCGWCAPEPLSRLCGGRWSQGGTMQISSYFFSHLTRSFWQKTPKQVTNQWWEKVNASTLPLHTSRVSSWYQMFFFRRTHLRSWITVPIPSEITRVWSCLVPWSSHWEASGIVTTIFDDIIHLWCTTATTESRYLNAGDKDASEENGAYVSDGD